MESKNQTTEENDNPLIGSSTLGRERFKIEHCKDGTHMCEIKLATGSGSIPQELSGRFTGEKWAEKAIATHLRKKNTPPTPYQARQKAKRAAAKKQSTKSETS